MTFAAVLVVPDVHAEPAPSAHASQASGKAQGKRCRVDEDAYKVLRLTTFEGGVRVDYEFIRSGAASWTNMNRPLLRQFGVRIGATICLPRAQASAEDMDFD